MSVVVPLRGAGRVYCFERVSHNGQTGVYIWPSGRERFGERVAFSFPKLDEGLALTAELLAKNTGVRVDEPLKRLIACWDLVDRVLKVLAHDRSIVEDT